ncbi:MAG: hypothetical protein JW904_09800 [Spirochaetales bacterium]|nr:hypothetical protein [Spirochaetales bacterium]
MKKLVLALIFIFILFTVINAYTAPTVNIQEFAQDKNNFGIGIGVLENVDQKRQSWNVFPLHVYIKSGERSVFLAFNVLTIIFNGSTNYSKQINASGTYNGDIVSVGGKVYVTGKVNGDIWAFNADVVLGKNATVSGNVVTIGGSVFSSGSVAIQGSKYVVSDLQFPLMGILVSPNPGSIFLLNSFHIYSILLFIVVLFLLGQFWKSGIQSISQMVTTEWRGALVFALLALLTIPLIMILIISSRIGILIIPLLCLFLFAISYSGYIGIAVKIGSTILKREASGNAGLLINGGLGFVVLNGLTIIGLVLSLVSGGFFILMRDIFLTAGAIVSYVALMYGLGLSMLQIKNSMQ